jgi:N-acetylglutamate synthase-like GNAT family acetyltransferase
MASVGLLDPDIKAPGFTYLPEFFRKVEFREVERGELPLKVWKDCEDKAPVANESL